MRSIYGIHDAGGEHLLGSNSGWIVHTEAIGCDELNKSGKSYPGNGVGNVVRLNCGYGTGGTIPLPKDYIAFARRCANFVAASTGIDCVIIGNEIAMEWDWPEGQPITLDGYMQCYLLCYEAIRAVNRDIQIGPAPVATWNNKVSYAGNERGDWIQLQADSWRRAGTKIDVLFIHAYSHGYDPRLITDETVMGAPFGDRFFNFQVYRQFMQAVPRDLRALPVHITEANGDGEWSHYQEGWIPSMYGEINRWNQVPSNQQIHSVALFRWQKEDTKWDFSVHSRVHDDFRSAVAANYQPGASNVVAPVDPIAPAKIEPRIQQGMIVRATRTVKLRQFPAITSLELTTLKAGELATIAGHSITDGGLVWWPAIAYSVGGSISGYICQFAPDLVPMFEVAGGDFRTGDFVRATTDVNMRVKPGKNEEIVTLVRAGADLELKDGPHYADDIAWWGVEGGYVAEATSGILLFKKRPSDIFSSLGRQYSIDLKMIKALMSVESGGSGFTRAGLKIRFEPHVFVDSLPDSRQREAAVNLFRMGSPRWKGDQHHMFVEGRWFNFHDGGGPKEYMAFNAARGINEDLAHCAISMGIPQIMGFNHHHCGYGSAREMFLGFSKNEDVQVEALFRYLASTGALALLRAGKLLEFATSYNGPGDPAGYVSKLRAAFLR